jgi:nucleotide-binding universal stress UspA family protein
MIRICRILCPIDLSDTSLRALSQACALSRWYDAPLTALLVEAPSLADASPREVWRGQMQAFAKRVASDTEIDYEVEESAHVPDAIVGRARALPAELIVMGSRGRSGLKGALLGSVAERVLRAAPCPVMVVPPHDTVPTSTASFKHLVCPVDFSESSVQALTWALSLAEEADARLSLLHVQEVPPELLARALDSGANLDEVHAASRADALARLRSLVPEGATRYCSIDTAATSGAAGREILKFAEDHHADLIVMGARGHNAIDRFFFGSKTQEVVRRATCPVFTVR